MQLSLFLDLVILLIAFADELVSYIKRAACFVVLNVWNQLHLRLFVFTRSVYGNGQNNEYLPGCLHTLVLSDLDKMHFPSTSANIVEVVETRNEHFIMHRAKRR